jgi:hypothetical protein
MISQIIRQRLQALNMGSQLPRLAELQELLSNLEERLATAKSNIGLLDRLNILSDSPDEVKVKALTAQISGHRKEFVEIGGRWNQALADLENEFPNFRIVRSVERLCSPCLEFVFGQAPNPISQVTATKKELFNHFFSEFNLANLFQSLSKPENLTKLGRDMPQSAEWPVLKQDELLAVLAPICKDYSGWSLDNSPFQLNQSLGQLGVLMSQYKPLACVLALAQLEILLSNSSPVGEARLEQDGSLKVSAGVPLGACIVDCLDRLHQALRECFPDVPFGFEVQSWFRTGPEEQKLSSRGDQSKWRQLQTNIQMRSLALVALNSLLERAKSQVSLLDRVNVFSDSETEVREKKLKAAITQAKTDLMQLPQDCQAGPGLELDDHNLASLVAHHTVQVVLAIQGLSTNTGDSWRKINCVFKGQSELAEALGAFRNWLQDRYNLPYTLKQLLEEVSKSPAVDEPIGHGNLPKILAARLCSTPLSEMLQEARQKRKDALTAFKDRRVAVNQVSLLDRLNIFSESASEKAEKQADSKWRNAYAAANESEDRLEATLMNALRQYPEAHLFYATEELALQVPTLKAVCRKSETTNSNGDKKTRYYCEIEGLPLVERLGLQLAQLAHSCGCIHGGQATNLTIRRLSWVEDPVILSALPKAASQSHGLKPGEVQSRVDQEPLWGGGAFEGFYLAWCQQNDMGPASPGRF